MGLCNEMNAILGGSEYCFSGYPGNDECVADAGRKVPQAGAGLRGQSGNVRISRPLGLHCRYCGSARSPRKDLCSTTPCRNLSTSPRPLLPPSMRLSGVRPLNGGARFLRCNQVGSCPAAARAEFSSTKKDVIRCWRVTNRNRGRLPDAPIFPGNSIRSNAIASGTRHRSISAQNSAVDRVRPSERCVVAGLVGALNVLLAAALTDGRLILPVGEQSGSSPGHRPRPRHDSCSSLSRNRRAPVLALKPRIGR